MKNVLICSIIILITFKEASSNKMIFLVKQNVSLKKRINNFPKGYLINFIIQEKNKLNIKSSDKILFIGNSITQGAQPEIEYLKENILYKAKSKNIDFELPDFKLAGVSGEQVAQGLKRLDPILSEYKPTICVVNYGTCEVTFENIHLFKSSMQLLINKLKDTGAQIVLITAPPCSSKNWNQPSEWPIEQFQKGLPQIRKLTFELAKENKLIVVDSYKTLSKYQKKNKVDLTTDGIHFSKEGYRIMANDLLEVFSINTKK